MDAKSVTALLFTCLARFEPEVQALGVDQGVSATAVVRRVREKFLRQIEAEEDIAAVEDKIAANMSRTHRATSRWRHFACVLLRCQRFHSVQPNNP